MARRAGPPSGFDEPTSPSRGNASARRPRISESGTGSARPSSQRVFRRAVVSDLPDLVVEIGVAPGRNPRRRKRRTGVVVIEGPRRERPRTTRRFRPSQPIVQMRATSKTFLPAMFRRPKAILARFRSRGSVAPFVSLVPDVAVSCVNPSVVPIVKISHERSGSTVRSPAWATRFSCVVARSTRGSRRNTSSSSAAGVPSRRRSRRTAARRFEGFVARGRMSPQKDAFALPDSAQPGRRRPRPECLVSCRGSCRRSHQNSSALPSGCRRRVAVETNAATRRRR